MQFYVESFLELMTRAREIPATSSTGAEPAAAQSGAVGLFAPVGGGCNFGTLDLPFAGQRQPSRPGAVDHLSPLPEFTSHVDIPVPCSVNQKIVMAGLGRHLLFHADKLNAVVVWRCRPN